MKRLTKARPTMTRIRRRLPAVAKSCIQPTFPTSSSIAKASRISLNSNYKARQQFILVMRSGVVEWVTFTSTSGWLIRPLP